MILLDTDHLSVVLDARHSRHGHLIEKLRHSGDSVALPVVAIEEQLRAWLAQIRRVPDARKLIHPYDRLIRLLDTLRNWDVVRWNEGAADMFQHLRRNRVRIGTQDLKIASIALANDALLLTANLRDFEKAPGLHVEDWLSA
jgi:tRNA(fMet)-specific endonuclease VapC